MIDVSDWQAISDEQMGTKRKVWLLSPTGERWLFKYPRSMISGEDWAEKVVAEIAELLAIPHAFVDLATLGDSRGVIVRDFLERDEDDLTEVVVHGNELLGGLDSGYPIGSGYRVAQHTAERIERSLLALQVGVPIRGRSLPDGFDGLDVFVGYLMLDVLVSNQDRHHENWAICMSFADEKLRVNLAPTFDHASSLAFNETDASRERRLTTRDRRGGVAAYVRRAASAIYEAGARKPLPTIEAFRRFGAKRPHAMAYWIERLDAVPPDELVAPVLKVPAARMGAVAKELAVAIVKENRDRLLEEVT